MATIRLRYENGHFIPLDEVPDLEEGMEIEAEIHILTSKEMDSYMEMLERTRGIWADVEGLEEAIEEARAAWDQAWRDRLNSL